MGMMLDWLGAKHDDEKIKLAADIVQESVAAVLKKGKIRTRDLCVGEWANTNPSSTKAVTTAIIEEMKSIQLGR
jgi:isocitrate/isopropylmalate dehydrogenase